MKLYFILLCVILSIIIINNNNLSVLNNNVIIEKKESYEACLKLKTSAPNLNLNCDHLLDNINTNEKEKENKKNEIDNTEIKTLFVDESHIRKVNKVDETKLKNLIDNIRISSNNQSRNN